MLLEVILFYFYIGLDFEFFWFLVYRLRKYLIVEFLINSLFMGFLNILGLDVEMCICIFFGSRVFSFY